LALKHSPSQTVGPYFSMCLSGAGQNALVPVSDAHRIRVVARVYDADREPIDDALLEIWQANALGRYRHPADDREEIPLTPGFRGFGRVTAEPGTLEYVFDTVKPGRVPAPDGTLQAPHIGIIVQGRGMLRPLFTRLYFADEPSANDQDFVLARVPPERRASLMAEPLAEVAPPTYRFVVKLQGTDETVFFDY
jgi:protocatechuate 3,4-dioxygenase alpha subunit